RPFRSGRQSITWAWPAERGNTQCRGTVRRGGNVGLARAAASSARDPGNLRPGRRKDRSDPGGDTHAEGQASARTNAGDCAPRACRPAMRPPAPSRRVAVFRSDLLRNSETFILNQVQSLQRWQPVLAGNRRVAGGLPIERVPIALPEPSSRLFQRIALQVSRLANTRHRATESLLASLDPDLVHIHFGTDAVDAWPTVARLAKPVVVTLHGYDVHIHRWWW